MCIKFTKKNLVLFIVISFIFTCLVLNSNKVSAKENLEEKIYCTATIEDEFATNRVLVVLDKGASYSNKIYNRNDFSTINCKEVKDLTYEATNVVQKRKNNSLIDVNNYRRVLSVELSTNSKENVLNVIDELIKLDDVIYVGPDYKITVASNMPNDTLCPSQWSIDSLQLEQAWDISVGTSNVLVGVMDSGIDGSHPDLQSSIVNSLCRDFTSGGEAEVDELIDPSGHGTHVAGIIGAVGNNGRGIAGVNWNVGLVSLRVFDELGMGYSSYVAEAIEYAERNDIPILNFSGRWYGDESNYDVALDTVIQAYSGLVVCGAGNECVDNDGGNPALPASYNFENIISVGAIDSNSNRWSFSNYGRNTVDIFAPGKDILSTFPESKWDYYVYGYTQIMRGYANCSGTSMAAPHVTGVAALLLSINEDLTNTQLKTAILESVNIPNVDGTNPLQGLCATNGTLNAYNAVKYVLEHYSNIPYTLSNSSLTINDSKSISGGDTYFNNKNGFYRLDVTYTKDYEFSISSDYVINNMINVILYDENFNEVTFVDLDSSDYSTSFVKKLSIGTYYLRTKYAFKNASGIINTQIISIPIPSVRLLEKIENDILLSANNDACEYYFTNNTPGFYSFTLTGVKKDGTIVTYPSGAIKVYDDSNKTTLLNKLDFAGYDNEASTKYNENSMVVYLSRIGEYYLDINMNPSELESLNINISPVMSIDVNLFDLSSSQTDSTTLISQNIKGDYFEKIELKQAGKFTITNSYSGNSANNMLVVFAKLTYNKWTDKYTLETKMINTLNIDNNSVSSTMILTEGTYYIGYFNKGDNGSFYSSLTRIITESSTMKLISDPDMFTLYGSEVRFNNGSCRGNTLTVGFTRFIYLDNTLSIPSQSRLDYYLYSSDESIATISPYGTLLGKSAGTVKIMAVYKNNPTIVYTKQFTVLEDSRRKDLIINIEDTVEYTEENQIYEVSLNDTNCPYPQNTLYEWSIVEPEEGMTISSWGTVKLDGIGTIVIEGVSKLNPKVIVRITLTVK